MAASEVQEMQFTWSGDVYVLRCVEQPDYRIISTIWHNGIESTVFHDRKIIGRATSLDDAKRQAQGHADGA
jgi:hypothetical protein